MAVLLPEQPAPPATGCAVVEPNPLQPESQVYIGSFESLLALCDSLLSESETALSLPVSKGLLSKELKRAHMHMDTQNEIS